MRQVSKIFGAAIEAYLAVVLDDLEAVAVELRLMQPGNASRDDGGDAGADELDGAGHATALCLLGITASRDT